MNRNEESSLPGITSMPSISRHVPKLQVVSDSSFKFLALQLSAPVPGPGLSRAVSEILAVRVQQNGIA